MGSTHNRWRVACAGLVLALTASLVAAPPASAEVQHPRQQWLRASTAGLFLHWGMFTAPKHLDCDEWERDVTGGGWTPDYWVDEARKLGASYLVLATFHSRLGYARPWPSKIPGSCATERDLLGELVKAGNAKGVRIILYMTDDPQWHNEQGIETLDSAAYSAYKGKQVDLTTRDGFGMYSYDLFFEVMDGYPDLAGFWIDNDNAYWEQNKLYEQIREKRPSWLLSNNNEDTPIMDTVSNEQKTGMTPSYDYPQAAFTPMPRLTEACYKLPTTGDWWYSGGDHAVDFRLSTGRYVTNAGIVDEVADGRDADGERQAPARPGDVQQLHGRVGAADPRVPVRRRGRRLHVRRHAAGLLERRRARRRHGRTGRAHAVRPRRHPAAFRPGPDAGQRLPGDPRDRPAHG